MSAASPIAAQLQLNLFMDGSVQFLYQGNVSMLLDELKNALEKKQLQAYDVSPKADAEEEEETQA
ncbi:hypothetical protein [Chromobacterium amazonense]|uniref:hypothetical protein n=1 Tax=Chromobacterium amazonense TaxID=1382803 RepID=UPI00237E1D6C|nr:hypothetical protein [Chromobacterium amazonense]MDE1714519.1 hypothetical protein [Chromobacterium amazonense]